MNKPEIVLCAPVRTPIGAFGGALKETPATTLGAAVVRETLRRSGLPSEAVDTVVLGQVIQAGARMNPARQATIGGGLIYCQDRLRSRLRTAFSSRPQCLALFRPADPSSHVGCDKKCGSGSTPPNRRE